MYEIFCVAPTLRECNTPRSVNIAALHRRINARVEEINKQAGSGLVIGQIFVQSYIYAIIICNNFNCRTC